MSLPEIFVGAEVNEGRLRLIVRRPTALGRDRSVQAVVVSHSPLESHWCWQGPADEEGDRIVVSVDVDPGWGRVLELSSLASEHRADSPQSAALRGGVDFERVLIVIEGDRAHSGAEAAAALDEVLAARERVYDRGLGVGIGTYRAVVLLEGVLLTRRLRVAGIEAVPIGPSPRGRDIPELLNRLLEEFGSGRRVQRSTWAEEYARLRPMVVCVVHRIHADNHEEASAVASEHVALLGSLLSIQRGASATVLGGVVEGSADSSGFGGWITTSSYAGNLLGGFVSGESQTDTYSRFNAVRDDSRLELWLTLHRDALAEPRWDFRFFRHFNLLEAIGREFFGESAPLTTWSGAPLAIDGTQATTGSARGKVYALLHHVSSVVQVAESSWCVAPATSAWEDMRVWVGIRDAVAHDGGLRRDAATRIRSARVLPARFSAVADRVLAPEQQYLGRIAEASSFVVLALLDGRVSFPVRAADAADDT